MIEITNTDIERVAREMCMAKGEEPDLMLEGYRIAGDKNYYRTRYNWERFAEDAEEQLRKLKEHDAKDERIRPAFVFPSPLTSIEEMPWAFLSRLDGEHALSHRFTYYPDQMNKLAQQGNEFAMLCRYIYERGIQQGRAEDGREKE